MVGGGLLMCGWESGVRMIWVVMRKGVLMKDVAEVGLRGAN